VGRHREIVGEPETATAQFSPAGNTMAIRDRDLIGGRWGHAHTIVADLQDQLVTVGGKIAHGH
jgi:hypothetical protein